MKTFRIIMPLLMLMLVFSCKNEKVDMQQFVAERDSILQDNRSKTQQLDELNGVLSTIAIGLDSIAVQENILFNGSGRDGVRLDKHEIAARLNGMADILAKCGTLTKSGGVSQPTVGGKRPGYKVTSSRP